MTARTAGAEPHTKARDKPELQQNGQHARLDVVTADITLRLVRKSVD